MKSLNFQFLKEYDPIFHQLAVTAEHMFASDPNTTVVKMRQLGEAIARDLAEQCGFRLDSQTSQHELISRLERELRFDPQVKSLFHEIRKAGNHAAHEFRTSHADGMRALKLGRELAIWYHRSCGKNASGFSPGGFVKPVDPSEGLQKTQLELNRLRADLKHAQDEAGAQKQLAESEAREREEAEKLALLMEEEKKLVEELALESEQQFQAFKAEQEKRNEALRKELNEQEARRTVGERTRTASRKLDLSEEETRQIIDGQLRDAGWEADTAFLRYANGARPEMGRNLAIAEWPIPGKQRADYVLFAGLVPVAVVEAKKKTVDVPGRIPQAERYARGFELSEDHQPAWKLAGLEQPWDDGQGATFGIPFVYSCNGRPYLKQRLEQSGTWFRDLRTPSNLRTVLENFHSPEGLLDRLERSRAAAEAALADEPFDYLGLREYQEQGIRAVEQSLEAGAPRCLLAMATGTGKTRTAIGLIYRFLKTERFRRILFLVDRNTLGTQACDNFDETTLERNLPLSKLFNIAELTDQTAGAEDRLHVSTVQAMVRRVYQSDDPPPVDAYDCVIVDEAHRGYTLDQEMTEGELEFRDQAQYLSAYRRVLDYFDAVGIGMTATPAIHTSEIFGPPVFEYTYREAVAADYLIDHEPPITYQTQLAKNGIHFEKGEQVTMVNTGTGELHTAELPDDLDFDIEAFNKRVITRPFNEVICKQLAKELDPMGERKVLIFCATDAHCDLVKQLLDEAFRAEWGEEYNEAAVRKITGKSDQVGKLIRHYKNEKYPTIALTVDLLTTGVDVHPICHLVFLRRVKSRVLYEQMIGRATRRCDRIGKDVFLIHDPVGLYKKLEKVTSMKPLVKDPHVTLEQLIGELMDPATHQPLADDPERSHADDVLDALAQKVMRKLRKACRKSEDREELRKKLEELEEKTGVPPADLHTHIRKQGVEGAVDFLRRHPDLVEELGEIGELVGTEYLPVISQHEDRFIGREQTYGAYGKPEDYLQAFQRYITENLNELAALGVVVNRPRDLTRQQLVGVRQVLDGAGFNEAKLKSAWKKTSNRDIAATIIGHIRQAALGEPLVPFAERVDRAMEGIYAMHDWSVAQKKWLARLAKQLVHEVVIDKSFVNQAFATDGGAARLDERLDHQLDDVLDALADHLWSKEA